MLNIIANRIHSAFCHLLQKSCCFHAITLNEVVSFGHHPINLLMCGIVAYIGHREAYPIILKGLKRLEYRGYDSAGVALISDKIDVFKKQGKVALLEESLVGMKLPSTIGIGHTRWATHGEPSDKNAHPHLSTSGRISMIHNGIIENYAPLKQELLNKGHQFHSDTDSEVLLNFIDDILSNNKCTLEEAVRIALKRIVGTYVIVLLDADNPDTLIAARKGSPLVIGIGENEHFLASDASPIIEYTKEVVYIIPHNDLFFYVDQLSDELFFSTRISNSDAVRLLYSIPLRL